MMRPMACVALGAAWLMTAILGSALADENFRWRVDHFDTLVNKPQTTYFETEREAQDYKQKWEKVQNLSKGSPAYINWKITKESKPAKAATDKKKDSKDGEKRDGDLLSRLRDAKDAADRAVRNGTDDLARAIRDYKQAVEDAYRRIKDFERDLVGGTQELQEKRFREVNSLVDRYNRQVADFQSVMGPSVPLGYKPLPRFEAPAAPSVQPREEPAPDREGSSVAGKTWEIDYYSFPLIIKLQAGGKAAGFYNREVTPRQGTWQVDGANISVVLPSSGRPGYSSYSEGFTVKGRIGAGGQFEVVDIQKNIK